MSVAISAEVAQSRESRVCWAIAMTGMQFAFRFDHSLKVTRLYKEKRWLFPTQCSM
jgi:hypothetical protein